MAAATTTTTTATDNAAKQEQNLELRTAISDAYAAVQGTAAVATFNAITFEELANQQILRISGPDTQSRPNELNRVQKVLSNLTQAVAKIKALPPDAFVEPNTNDNVNTPVEPDVPGFTLV